MRRENPTPQADAPAAVADFPPAPAAVEPAKSSAPEFFATDHLHDDLKGRSVRGGAATLGGQAASFVLKLGSTAVLARLLTPADFGLIAMVTAVTGFVAMFKDAGLSMATVQRAEIEHGQISSLFWVNLGLSLVLMLVVAALAPGVAWFYGEPCLLAVTLALAALFPLGGLTIQHQALLRRQMRFGTLASIGVASQAVGIAAALTAAASGASYWALVAMFAASGASNTALVWLLCPWRPGLPARGTGVRPMLAFGGNLSASRFLIFVRRNADKILLGTVWGAGPVGFYAKAYQLLALPLGQVSGPVTAITVPVLSRLQGQSEKYRRYCCAFVRLVAILGLPLVAFSFAAADRIVLAVLGKQWEPSIALFRVLAPAALVGAFPFAEWLFVSLNHTDRQLRANLCSTVVVASALVIGLHWGPVGVATALSTSFCLSYPVVIAYSLHDSPVSVQDVVMAIWRPLTASIVGAASVLAMSSFFPDSKYVFVELLTAGTLFAACYFGTLLLLPGGGTVVREVGRSLIALLDRETIAAKSG